MRSAYLAPALLLALFASHASAADKPMAEHLAPKDCAKPVWPGAALRLGQEGKVTFRYMTDHDGTVLQAEVIKSSGYPLLDDAARQGLMKCKMPDAAKADPALHAWNKIQYVWTLATRTPEELAARLAEVNAGVARGEAAAMHELGMIHVAGRGVARDAQAGIEWLRKAADKAHWPSYEALAGFYNFGTHVERDVPQAERLLRTAAEQGLASSQGLLGMLLVRGVGIDARPDEGLAWLRKAAEAGDLNGQSYLGMELMRRPGDDNRNEAIKWLALAAERGNINAQFYLGQSTLRGNGMGKDPVRGLELITRAGHGGHLHAQTTLGELYAEGLLGVTADPVQARYWRSEAAKTLQRPAAGVAAP